MADRNDATQDPTATRLRRAEQSGQFAHSRELAVAVVWLGGVALLATFGGLLWNSLDAFSQHSWSSFNINASANESLRGHIVRAQSIFWSGLLPIIGGVAAITILVWSAQGGFRLIPHLAAPDLNRLNPASNLRRTWSSEQLVSIILGLIKFVVLLLIAAWVLLGDLETLTQMGFGPLAHQSKSMSEWLMAAVQRLCVAAVVVGVGDYGVRWWLHRRSLSMSDQEVRDEQRSSEPSPEIEARRRLRM